MKLKIIVIVSIAFICILGSFKQVYSFSSQDKKIFNYVIIGAFTYEGNALEYIEFAEKFQLKVEYALNPNRNLFYVYMFVSEDRTEAVNKVVDLREKHPEFIRAWVYSGNLKGSNSEDGNTKTATSPKTEIVKIPSNSKDDPSALEKSVRVESDVPLDNALIEEATTTVAENPDSSDSSNNSDPNLKSLSDLGYVNSKKVMPAEIVVDGHVVPRLIDSLEEEPIIEEDYKVYINATSLKTGNNVIGPVEIFDKVRNRVINRANTHNIFGQNDPNNGTSEINIVSRIFGYRPKTLGISLANVDTTEAAYTYGDSLIVNLELERLKRGDLAVMWNVLFYKDAAVMRAESKGELNSLLEMLKEEKEMKVVLHGHSNGNTRGKIINLGENDNAFFDLRAEEHQEINGSAKKLSLYRAETIMKWLQDNEIATDRIQVKGWGGKRMLHDKHDPKAYENVRVEVEVLN